MFYELKKREFEEFKKIIYETAGIKFNDTKTALVSNRLGKRLRFYGFETYSEYLEHIKTDPSEFQIMIDSLTTNETSFFREIEHFHFLESTLQNPPRVWSAACSSGAEPYSVAMMLANKFGMNGWEIIASDISTKVLQIAKKAQYALEKVEGVPQKYRRDYCLKGVNKQEGTFLIKEDLKRKISFWQINLNKTLPAEIGLFDVIMLRNVMIYFDNNTKKEVVERLFHKLKPGGYLILGHSETLHGITQIYKQVKPTIYQRS